MSHLLSQPVLLLATVEAATGKPGFEEIVTFSRMTLALLFSEWPKKLGNVSSAIFLKFSIILHKLLKIALCPAT